MAHTRRLLGPDRSAARFEARTLALRHSDVEAPKVPEVTTFPLEEEDESLGWLISLLVEENATLHTQERL